MADYHKNQIKHQHGGREYQYIPPIFTDPCLKSIYDRFPANGELGKIEQQEKWQGKHQFCKGTSARCVKQEKKREDDRCKSPFQ